MKKPKIVIVHEFLTQFGGAEKTLEAISEIYPDAPIHTARLNRAILSDSLKQRQIIAPNYNSLGKLSKYLFTFMMAPVFESMDFSNYDIVISDGNTWNKGILTKPNQLHITYIHTPPRFLYKYSTESSKRNKGFLKVFFSYLDNILRLWDYTAAQRPDYILTNSKEVQRRIKKFYGRDAKVIYPPVEIDIKPTHKPNIVEGPYYIAVGRLVKYKNFDMLIQAFNLLGEKLVIVGEGPMEKQLKQISKENIIFAGRATEQEKHNLLANALGLINTVQDEDLGIVPIEAMSHGVPVLVHKSGGHLETVKENVTGMFFEEATTESIVKSFKDFDTAIRNKTFDKAKIISSVQHYNSKRFKEEFENYVTQAWELRSKAVEENLNN